MSDNVTFVPIRSLVLAWATLARDESQTQDGSAHDLKVFLDGDREFESHFQAAVDLVTYVDDRRDADVCVRATPLPAQGTDRQYHVSFVGAGRFELIEASARLRFSHTDDARTDDDRSVRRRQQPAPVVAL
jgi:hypothetical protein